MTRDEICKRMHDFQLELKVIDADITDAIIRREIAKTRVDELEVRKDRLVQDLQKWLMESTPAPSASTFFDPLEKRHD